MLFGILIIVNIFVFDSAAILSDPGSPVQTIIRTIKSPQANIAWGQKELIPYNQQVFQHSSPAEDHKKYSY